MKKSKQFKTLVQKTFAIGIAVVVIGGPASILYADEPKSDATPKKTDSTPSQTNSVETKAVSPDADKVATKELLIGAELYSIHCNRCHPERYPTERTAAQWKTIMLHMQIRANIPGSQARMILKYLQDNSGR